MAIPSARQWEADKMTFQVMTRSRAVQKQQILLLYNRKHTPLNSPKETLDHQLEVGTFN